MQWRHRLRPRPRLLRLAVLYDTRRRVVISVYVFTGRCWYFALPSSHSTYLFGPSFFFSRTQPGVISLLPLIPLSSCFLSLFHDCDISTIKMAGTGWRRHGDERNCDGVGSRCFLGGWMAARLMEMRKKGLGKEEWIRWGGGPLLFPRQRRFFTRASVCLLLSWVRALSTRSRSPGHQPASRRRVGQPVNRGGVGVSKENKKAGWREKVPGDKSTTGLLFWHVFLAMRPSDNLPSSWGTMRPDDWMKPDILSWQSFEQASQHSHRRKASLCIETHQRFMSASVTTLRSTAMQVFALRLVD